MQDSNDNVKEIIVTKSLLWHFSCALLLRWQFPSGDHYARNISSISTLYRIKGYRLSFISLLCFLYKQLWIIEEVFVVLHIWECISLRPAYTYIHTYIHTCVCVCVSVCGYQPVSTRRTWCKVSLLAEFNRFEFRVFLLVNWLPNQS